MDTSLLSHIINENSSNALKRIADEWRDDLGINPHALANQEQKELDQSMIGKGGHYPFYLGKYACAWYSTNDCDVKFIIRVAKKDYNG